MDYRLAGGKLRNRGVHVRVCAGVCPCVTFDSRPASGSRVNEPQDGLPGNFTCCQKDGLFLRFSPAVAYRRFSSSIRMHSPVVVQPMRKINSSRLHCGFDVNLLLKCYFSNCIRHYV